MGLLARDNIHDIVGTRHSPSGRDSKKLSDKSSVFSPFIFTISFGRDEMLF